MRDKILAAIQSRGPLLPVEIASAADTNSFLAKAYLSDLISEGKLKATKEKIGDSRLYYFPGQEQQVAERMQVLRQQQIKTAGFYQSAQQKSSVTPEIIKKRQDFTERLRKIEEEEKEIHQKPRVQVQQQKPLVSQPRPQMIRVPLARPLAKPTFSVFRKQEPEIRPQIREEKRVIEIKPEPKQMPDFLGKEEPIIHSPRTFVEKAKNFIETERVRVLEVLERKKKFAEFNALIPTPFGEIKFVVHIRDKQKVTDSDLSLLYSKASQKNLPGLLVTNGQLNRKANRFLETVKDSVKVKVI